MAREGSVELRTDCPREIVDVLDAVSTVHRLTRGQMVVRVLQEWARERTHEASVINRVLRSNPSDADDDGRERA